jgi:membrane carboxypeptidase/penicillin-binding protein
MRVRAALAKSKNLVTVRVLQAIGPQYAQDYIARFGFDPKLHPPYLTMGLGAGAATPLQMIDAYAVFANGGYRVTPYLISRIVDARGNVLSEAQPTVAGEGAERAIDPRNAWIMTSLLKDVVRVGPPCGPFTNRPTSRERQARRTRMSMRGSAATTLRSSPLRGSASTSRGRWAPMKPGPSPRYPSGSPTWRRCSRGRKRNSTFPMASSR